MDKCNEYCLSDFNNKVIAMGSQELMFKFVKHHVPDGRYKIIGPELRLHCVRENGVVGPDPDGVCLKAQAVFVADMLDVIDFIETPISEEEVE